MKPFVIAKKIPSEIHAGHDEYLHERLKDIVAVTAFDEGSSTINTTSYQRTDIFKTTALQAFTPSVADGVAAVPLDIIEEGVRDWEDYLVGYFIDKKLPFPLVRDVLQKTWKIKGTFQITTDQDVFYMNFSDLEERKIALEGGPICISGKLFVVKPWSRETESQRNKIQTLPICTDEATTNRMRLDFTKVCVEIPVEFAFPEHLSLYLGTRIAVVDVEYPWRPQACKAVKSLDTY
ncbi:hypothetical protein IFM89_000623 [Coptis chinensis]|uniref:DUF4283 domain-containing protein n=1 Tax=Coptis chinensis TaxID=261450 RepID=A0A835H8B9_9MAGN|nr:hypothetical protein IFM89_000623 [Coptis chinensis]